MLSDFELWIGTDRVGSLNILSAHRGFALISEYHLNIRFIRGPPVGELDTVRLAHRHRCVLFHIRFSTNLYIPKVKCGVIFYCSFHFSRGNELVSSPVQNCDINCDSFIVNLHVIVVWNWLCLRLTFHADIVVKMQTRDRIAERFNHLHDWQYPAAVSVIIISLIKTNIPSRLTVCSN